MITQETLNQQVLVRDEDGYGSIPLMDECWAAHPDEEDIRPWLKEHGLSFSICDMEGDVDDDHPAYVGYGNGENNISAWEPSSPGGGEQWVLASIYDTEDGPMALWLTSNICTDSSEAPPNDGSDWTN